MRRLSRTSDDALRLVREHGLVTLTHCGGGPSLVESIAGRHVKGSWWGHPAGDRIYQAATALESSPEVLVVKLVGGRVTFLHRALWPALLRIARDPGRAAAARRRLSSAALRLLGEVERRGELRVDELAQQAGWPDERELARAAKDLDAALLVHAVSMHAERGRHATALRTWALAVPDSARREAAHLSLEEARDALEAHGAHFASSSARAYRARAPTQTHGTVDAGSEHFAGKAPGHAEQAPGRPLRLRRVRSLARAAAGSQPSKPALPRALPASAARRRIKWPGSRH